MEAWRRRDAHEEETSEWRRKDGKRMINKYVAPLILKEVFKQNGFNVSSEISRQNDFWSQNKTLNKIKNKMESGISPCLCRVVHSNSTTTWHSCHLPPPVGGALEKQSTAISFRSLKVSFQTVSLHLIFKHCALHKCLKPGNRTRCKFMCSWSKFMQLLTLEINSCLCHLLRLVSSPPSSAPVWKWEWMTSGARSASKAATRPHKESDSCRAPHPPASRQTFCVPDVQDDEDVHTRTPHATHRGNRLDVEGFTSQTDELMFPLNSSQDVSPQTPVTTWR